MIRVSEEVEKQLKELADGRSMSATVEMLIKGAGNTADNMFSLTKEFMGHIDEKFDELKSLIEDTTVDRVNNGGPRTQSVQEFVSLEWPDVQELLYEKMKEGDPEWFPGAYKGVTEEMQGDPNCFSKDGVLYINLSGSDIPVLRITPRVGAMLAEIIERNINVA